MTVKFTVKLLHKLTQTTERGNNMAIEKKRCLSNNLYVEQIEDILTYNITTKIFLIHYLIGNNGS